MKYTFNVWTRPYGSNGAYTLHSTHLDVWKALQVRDEIILTGLFAIIGKRAVK